MLQARDTFGVVRQPPVSDRDLRKALLWFIRAFTNRTTVAHPTSGGAADRMARRTPATSTPVVRLILKVMLQDIPHYGPRPAGDLRRVGGGLIRQAML